MELFRKVLKPGAVVVEVGGHIGYLSIFFAKQVGPEGAVYVFEPGRNNLPYTRENLKRLDAKTHGRAHLIEKAVGQAVSEIEFYEDSLTGQNNSAVKGFAGLAANASNAYVDPTVRVMRVQQTTLDAEFSKKNVDLIKIDIEGYEYSALRGAQQVLTESRPVCMVEIQADRGEIARFFHELGYVAFDPSMKPVTDPVGLNGNIFWFHAGHHSELIASLARD